MRKAYHATTFSATGFLRKLVINNSTKFYIKKYTQGYSFPRVSKVFLNLCSKKRCAGDINKTYAPKPLKTKNLIKALSRRFVPLQERLLSWSGKDVSQFAEEPNTSWGELYKNYLEWSTSFVTRILFNHTILSNHCFEKQARSNPPIKRR